MRHQGIKYDLQKELGEMWRRTTQQRLDFWLLISFFLCGSKLSLDIFDYFNMQRESMQKAFIIFI
jgi:hypothetical protein